VISRVLKPARRVSMVTPMDGMTPASLSDAHAVTMQVRENQQKGQEARNAARLIEAAMPRPLPADATFSTYA
jgi:hypothetical protein